MKITWIQEAEVAESQDCAIALQPGQQSKSMSQKQKQQQQQQKEDIQITHKPMKYYSISLVKENTKPLYNIFKLKLLK